MLSEFKSKLRINTYQKNVILRLFLIVLLHRFDVKFFSLSNNPLYKNLPKKITQLLNYFNASSDIIVICDVDLMVHYVSTNYTKLTGYKTKEVLGKSYQVCNGGAITKILNKKAWGKLHQNKSFQMNCYNTKKSGEHYQIEQTIIPVSDENNKATITHLIFVGKDTTKQVNTINKLTKSEKALGEVQKIAHLGYYVFDIKNDDWTSSEELNSIFGINKDYQKNFNSWLKLIHPEFKDLMLNYFTNEVLTKRKKFNKEYKIINQKTGQEKWVHGLGKLIFDENQKPIEMFGTIQDITEKKCIQVKLQENEERLNDIIFSLGDWVWEMDENDKFTYSSTQVNNIIGIASEEIIGKAPFGSMLKDEAKRVSEIFSEIKANKAPIKDIINWHINKEGEEICLLTNGVPIIDKDGNLKGYRGVDKNITETKRSQEELAKEERKYKILIDTMNEGVVKVDNNDIIQFVNNKFCEQLGYSEKELIGKIASDTVLYSDREKRIIKFKINKRQKNISDTYELACKNKKGEKKWFLVSGSPSYDEEGNIDGSIGIHTDITEKRKIEQNLKASEKKFRELFEKSSDAILIIENGIFVDCNDSTSKMLGYESTREFLNTHPSNLSPQIQPDGINSYEKAETMMNLTFKKGSHRFEWIHTKKDGTNFPVEVLLTPISSESGNKILHCVWRDISDRKKAEQELIASEDKYRSIFHSLTTGMIIVIDEKGYVLEWNKGAEINFGYDKHEMLHKPLSMFMPKRYRKGHEKGLAIAVKNKGLSKSGVTYNLFGLHKNGDEFPIELTLGSWERDGKLFFSAIIIDVTGRKEAEKHLLQANSILEDVDSVVLLTNRNGNIIFTTSSIKRLIGFEPTEILGDKWWNATFVDEIESNRVKNELISYLKSNNIVRTTNHPRLVKCKDGTLKWFEWHNSRGVDNCIISVGYDITEKKIVEQQLQNTLNNLENLVHARTKELENTLDKLEISLNKEKELGELKSRFVSTASHQFRTPLTVIQANIGLINMQVDSLNSEFKEKLSKVTSRIQSEVNRMSELMNDVLILGKVNTNRIKPNYKPTNLVAIANEIVSKYNSIQTDGRKINLVIHGKPFNIMLDGNLFEHTISNLISNAFKYSVGYPDPILTLSFEQKQVFISVKDFGIGIPPNDLKHLFQTFFRASNANDFPGTGLGIAIAKEYAELNGGNLSVTSILNEGSEFTVVFNK